ncbi:MAG: MgtC/SapB family protein [Rubricoccaceae bacterium]|nr:MgtC/SapB family protein [Rubricoccaceae bacterium]
MPTELFLQDLETLAQCILAVFLGGVVGWERETKAKGAGFRTMMLVSLASFLIVHLSLYAGLTFTQGEEVSTDPIRAIDALVAGLGFVGAGIIFQDRSKGRVRGITTAASLLAVAPIGFSIALERYVLAVGITLLLLFILNVFDRFEKRFITEK